jgi:hypothetical protein
MSEDAYETVADIKTERDILKRAMHFYADHKRYAGPNQRLEQPDEYSEEAAPKVYLLDVTRDGGAIARKALDRNEILAAKNLRSDNQEQLHSIVTELKKLRKAWRTDATNNEKKTGNERSFHEGTCNGISLALERAANDIDGILNQL